MLTRLREVVRRAYSETEYYRELLTGIGFDPFADFGFDEYTRIPPLDREAVRGAGARLHSGGLRAAEARRDATGGSTGQPTEIRTGPEERGWRESGTEFYMRRIGVPKGSSVGLLWGHHLDPVASDRIADRIRAFAEDVRWFDCLRLSPEKLRGYHAELQQWRPRCIVAYASALAPLAETAAASGEQLRYPTRCFVTGAEKLMPHHRRLVQEVFRRPIHERYGSRDVGLMGFQLDGHDDLSYDIDWANTFLEPESESEEANILVTKLHADGMPMLRYRVGDIGRFPSGSRPGTPTFTLHEVVGRDNDRIWLRDGRWVHGISFPHLMKDHPVREFQVYQAADFAITVSIVPTEEFSDANRQVIARILEKNLPGLPLSILLVDQIPRTRSNKWRPVITEVNARAE
jgi:phenylacetate-CoA ligase